MNHLKNMPIGVKLATSFGVMVALLIFMALIGVSRMQSLRSGVDVIAGDRLPKVVAAKDVSFFVMDQARVARNSILVTNGADKAKNFDAFQKDREQIAAKLELLRRETQAEQGKALLAEVMAARAEYVPFIDDVIALAKQDKRDEAVALLFGPRYQTQGRYLKALEALVAYQQTSTQEAALDADNAYVHGVQWIIGIAAAAGVAAAALAWVTTRAITRPITQAVRVAQTVAGGDLTSRFEVRSTDETGKLLQALKAMNEGLVGIVQSVRRSSDSIATGSSQIATGNADLSQRTEEQASNLQQTAASMEELTSIVKQNSDTAQLAAELAAAASEAAVRGGDVVENVVSTMREISTSSSRISEIIGVIDGIAFQTNILALNASVEAARAGEQGRGFAVVAGEVRSLAQRSAVAAKEIKALIGESATRVEVGSRQAGDAGASIQAIVSQVKRVTELIGGINLASAEQSQGIQQIGDAVSQLDHVTQQNAALVEESAAAAFSLKEQAARLADTVGVFKIAEH